MVASLGASAVLVFGMPSSPLAQPWPVLGGSTLSALVGAACSAWVPDAALAGALAVGLAIALMVPLRCLHPPGGAMALYMVLSAGDGWRLAVFPILFNGLVLLATAMLYNGLTGRPYPHPQRAAGRAAAPEGAFTASDVDVALAHYNQVLDVSRADLEGLLHLAGRAAFQRTLGEVRCADIMSKPPLAVEPGTSLKDAWALMRSAQIKALPVVDAQQLVVGIVTVADFMRLANLDVHEGLGQRLRALVMGRSGQPEKVSEIMSHPVQVAGIGQHAMDLVPLFSHGGHHHIPIVDDDARLAGVITQTDLVRTLAVVVQGREADTAGPARPPSVRGHTSRYN
jgi:CBS domain-containing membrane protein